MVNVSGKLIEGDRISLSIANRGLNYGDAVFETLRFSGGKILFWEDHYFRLMSSMRILRMEIPMSFTMEFLESEIVHTLDNSDKNGDSYRVKLLIWRKTGGKYTPESNDVDYAISFEKIDHPFYVLQESECEVELFKDYFVPSGLLSTLKSNHRLINVLGSIFAKENGYQNCFLLNEKKQVVEALNGNIFMVVDNVVKTPPLTDGCLNGILRKQLIGIIESMPHITLEEASISPFELQRADEIFITNVILGLVPVSKYRKKKYGNKLVLELLPKLNLRATMG